MFLMAILPLVSAIPPITQVQQFTEGYTIKGTPQDLLKQGYPFQYNFFVYNISTGKLITNSSIECFFYLTNSTGDVIIFSNATYFEDNGHWGIDIGGNNFTNVGHYPFGVKCNSTIYGGAIIGYFEVTPNGEEATIGKAVFYIGLLFVLLFFLALCILSFVQFENIMNRVGMIGMGYLLLMAITFIGWNMASDFITSAPFLAEMLRTLFWVFIVGAFPLLIGGFAWYLILLFKIKEIENLMDHGLSRDEAEHRQGKTFKGGKH